MLARMLFALFSRRSLRLKRFPAHFDLDLLNLGGKETSNRLGFPLGRLT